jgi:hypothetical protein
MGIPPHPPPPLPPLYPKTSRMRTAEMYMDHRYEIGDVDEGDGDIFDTRTEASSDFSSHQIRMRTTEPEYLTEAIQQLLEEQEYSKHIMEELRRGHQQTQGLKQFLCILLAFSAVMSIINVGVASKTYGIAKESKIDQSDLVSITGDRIGTTSKMEQIVLHPIEESHRRHLEESTSELFSCHNGARSDTTTTTCQLQGQVNFEDLVKMHRKFCPGYQPGDESCSSTGVEKLNLVCNRKISTLYGGAMLADSFPSYSRGYYEFPSGTDSYVAEQYVRSRTMPSSLSSSSDTGLRLPCRQPFTVRFYCPVEEKVAAQGQMKGAGLCYAFTTFDRVCEGEVSLCGYLKDQTTLN